MKRRLPLFLLVFALTAQSSSALWEESGTDILNCRFSTDPLRDVCADWIDFNGNVIDICCVPYNDLGNPEPYMEPGFCNTLRPVSESASVSSGPASDDPPITLIPVVSCAQAMRARCTSWLTSGSDQSTAPMSKACATFARVSCSPIATPTSQAVGAGAF